MTALRECHIPGPAAAARAHGQTLRLPALVSHIDPANHRSARLAAALAARPDGWQDGSQVWRHWPAASTKGAD